MRNSDVAMYSVKAARRATRRRCTGPQLAGQGREKLELESALHKAIERDELVLHYQPKIDVRGAQDGRRRGADALAAQRRAGAAGRLHSAGRGDRPDRAAVRVGDPRGGAPGASLAGQLRLRRLDRGQPAEPPVRAHRPGRAHPPGGHDLRRAAPRDRARDHRDGPDEGPAERDPVAAPAQRDRRRDLDRRLRHRLLVARLPDDAADLRS